MRIGMLCLAAITCAGLAGCSNMLISPTYTSPKLRLFASPIPCSGTCTIDVKVIQNPDNTCRPVDIEPIDLAGDDGVRGIVFKLGDGYKFVDYPYRLAFFMKMNPEGKFVSSVVAADGKTVLVKFKVQNGVGNRNYTYGLDVQRDDGTYCTPLDPWMIS